MTLPAILLVVASAVLHAGWNLICKTQKSPCAVFFLILTVGSVFLWMPFAIWIFKSRQVEIPTLVWGMLVLSGLANAIYYVGLGSAYRISDISISYPLVKALPILIVTVFCIIFGAGKATLWGWVGISTLLMGSAFIPMKKFAAFSWKNYLNRSFGFVLAAAVASAGYMLLDNHGIKMLRAASASLEKHQISAVYIFFENLFILPFLLGFIMLRKEERGELAAFVRNFSPAPFITGIMCTLSYSLVLMAMSLSSNVGMVVALRQLSVPLGAFGGIVLLKEPGHMPKMVGALSIVGGLILVCVG
ncbi:MAG: hypothetical protein PHV34_08100 [Verrucomicrobiae bacterium]|nr:hypothetical protein [Verrucomicrobiae bacterium]